MPSSHSSALRVALVLFLASASACSNVALPGGSGSLPRVPALPGLEAGGGLDAILGRGPVVTTSFEDARTEIVYLDAYEPSATRPLDVLERTGEGGFVLVPGAFGFTAQSYCLHAGTHGPSGGDGYLHAPLEGPGAPTVRRILQRSVTRPDVAQRDVQALVWAVLARSRLQDNERLMRTAQALLEPEEILELNGGALGVVSREAFDRLSDRLPPAIRRVARAEAELRSLFNQAAYDYGALEAVAVLAGAAPASERIRDVPAGRWSYHPGGYFLRFDPRGYPTTEMQLVVPGPLTLRRDGAGRIATLTAGDGSELTVRYAEADPAPGTPAVAPLAGVELLRRRVVRPEITAEESHAVPGPAWTLVGLPDADPVGSLDVPGLEARLVASRALVEDLRRLPGESRGSGALHDVIDIAHLRAAVRSADPGAAAVLEFLDEAWQSGLCGHLGGCATGESAGGPTPGLFDASPFGGPSPVFGAGPAAFDAGGAPVPGRSAGSSGLVRRYRAPDGGVHDPSGGTATPANTGAQRLSQSGRSADDQSGDCKAARSDIEDARAARARYADEAALERARQNGWNGAEYQEHLFGSCEGCESPMHTNPSTCGIRVNWDRAEYRRRGLPDLSYDADMAHEQYHRESCLGRGNPMRYQADMSFPERLAEEERGAYDAKIRWLESWIAESCR